MPSRLTILTAILIAVLFFALGQFTARSKTTTADKKVDEVKNVSTKQNETITEVKKPDGTVTTVTTINTTQDTIDKVDTRVLMKIAPVQPKYNVSLLAVTTIHNPFAAPSYGLSISKEFIGLRVSTFGLTNGTFGVGIGVDF